METGIRDKALSVWERLLLRGISSVLIVTVLNLLTIDSNWKEISYTENISAVMWLINVAIAFAIISIINILLRMTGLYNVDAVILFMSSLLTGLMMLIEASDIYLSLITVAFVLFCAGFLIKRFPYFIKRLSFSSTTVKLTLFGLFLLTFIYVGTLVVLRYFLFKTPNFDFGIFSQMFYYMKETGLPMTTTERNYYLSHFAIHFSPVFYLILPVYFIFPHPVTLIVVQLLLVLSGAIPVYLMCKNKKYSGFITLGIVAVFLLYPTMRSGLFYDFHENKFLTPLLLWLLYFTEKEGLSLKSKNLLIAVFTMLSLMVKEDAAIYVACIGLFMLVYKKGKNDRLTGLFILLGAIIYFLIVYYLLGKYGAGSAINSIGRYDNFFVSDSDGLLDMLMNILKNPAYAVKQLLTAQKLEFVLWTMAPVLFVPLMSGNAAIYILLIPYLVINLLTNYGYQYDIGFQYTFGSCTLLIYMVILWFEGADTIKKRAAVILMVISSLLISENSIVSKNAYLDNVKEELDYCAEIFEILETIPEDKSVCADTWFVPALSGRREIYEYSENLDIETDFIVLDKRSKNAEEKSQKIVYEKLLEGYHVFDEIEEKIIILEK
ncbi:MAG: DUF2079 domain-containing protein [Lachnospiraceae bacterium]